MPEAPYPLRTCALWRGGRRVLHVQLRPCPGAEGLVGDWHPCPGCRTGAAEPGGEHGPARSAGDRGGADQQEVGTDAHGGVLAGAGAAQPGAPPRVAGAGPLGERAASSSLGRSAIAGVPRREAKRPDAVHEALAVGDEPRPGSAPDPGAQAGDADVRVGAIHGASAGGEGPEAQGAGPCGPAATGGAVRLAAGQPGS